MIPINLVLDRALRDAGLPIEGVRIGDPANRSTWVVFYAASATAEQRAQGDTLLRTIDPQDPTTIANIKQDLAATQINMDVFFAFGQALWEAIPSPTRDLAGTRARFLNLLKNRL